MSILFRIALPADDTPAPVAVITARQLAALRRYLRAVGDHMGLALIEPDEVIGDSFEARVCPLALAAVTGVFDHDPAVISVVRSEEHTSELQSLMRISYAVFCLKPKITPARKCSL